MNTSKERKVLKMKRVVTVDLTCTYVFDDEQYPMDEYNDDDVMDIAYAWFTECTPDVSIETDDVD